MPSRAEPMNIFADFNERITKAVEALDLNAKDGGALDLSRIAVEPPRDASHGDLATNAAMVLAKPTGQNPRALAERLVAELRKRSGCRHGRGRRAGLRQSPAHGRASGRRISPASCRGHRLWPLRHRQGHARSMSSMSRPTRPARCMSAIAAARSSATRWPTCLAFAGYDVTKEYYINDAGAQIDVLGRSVMLRYREALGEDDRRDPGRPLSGRLSRAGRQGAGGRVRRRPAADARGRGAAPSSRTAPSTP